MRNSDHERVKMMQREWLPFLNRYAILAASFSMFGFALIVLIFRSQAVGLPGIILAVLTLLMALFLLWVYLSNTHT